MYISKTPTKLGLKTSIIILKHILYYCLFFVTGMSDSGFDY